MTNKQSCHDESALDELDYFVRSSFEAQDKWFAYNFLLILKSFSLVSREKGKEVKKGSTFRLQNCNSIVFGFGFEQTPYHTHILEEPKTIKRSSSALSSLKETFGLSPKHTSQPQQQNLVAPVYLLHANVVLYDQWGFILHGGFSKNRYYTNTFEVESRRRTYGAALLEVRKSRRRSSFASQKKRRPMTRRSAPSSPRTSPKSSPSHSPPPSPKRVYSSVETGKNIIETLKNTSLGKYCEHCQKETLFVYDDIAQDCQQIRIDIEDPREVYHMVVVLYYDAPAYLFSEKWRKAKGIKDPKPYLRILDPNQGVELVRYSLPDLPKISVVVELDRIKPKAEVKPKLILPLEFENNNDKKNITESQTNEPKDNKDTSNTKEEKKDDNNAKQQKNEKDKEEKKEETKPEQKAEENNEKQIKQEKLKLEDQKTEKIQEKTCCWEVRMLKDEWHFVPKCTKKGREILASFLYQANLNDFASENVPQLPSKWIIEIFQAKDYENKKNYPMYCIVGSNSWQHTEKYKTKKSKTLEWNETFEL